MSEWMIIAIAAILVILSRLESINIKFKSNPMIDRRQQPKQLKK
jgi:hypothetical protein